MKTQEVESRFCEMVLEQLPVVALQRVASRLVERAVVEADHGPATIIADELVLRLQTTVWAERLASGTATAVKHVPFDEPTSPWQMFKRDSPLFKTRPGAAFLKRFPVRLRVVTKKVTLSASWGQYRTFPDADLPVPPAQMGKPVRLTLVSTDD